MSITIDYSQLGHIFRAYDIRGIYNEDITPDIFFRIGLAFGTFLQRFQNINIETDFIYTSYDIRQTSSMLAEAFISGVMATGINLFFSGEPLQFGACMFTAWRKKAFTVAFITASHLPPDWNGIKFYYGSGVGFSEDNNMKIKDIFINGDFIFQEWNKVGKMTLENLEEEYGKFLESRINIKKNLKVIVDCGNGSSCLSAPKILKKVGLHVIPLYCTVDPLFPNRSSEPDEKSLIELANNVKNFDADFGVGFDGDGDRAVIVDNKGRILLSDITGLILARELKKEYSSLNRVIINVECSLAFEKTLESIAKVERIKVGHTFLTAAAQEKKDCLIGVESSGHMVFPMIYLFDDAMLIPLFLAYILSKTNLKLSEIVDKLPLLHKNKLTVDCPDNIKFNVINDLMKELKTKYEINDVDGIGISVDSNSWVLIRASNTSPSIRITVEAKSEDNSKDLLNYFEKLLRNKIKINFN